MILNAEMRNTKFLDKASGKLMAVRTSTPLADVAKFEGKQFRPVLLEKHDFYRGDYCSPYYDYLLEEISE